MKKELSLMREYPAQILGQYSSKNEFTDLGEDEHEAPLELG